MIGSWYESLENPQKWQEKVLSGLIEEYKKTRYGVDHDADDVGTIPDFKASFPIMNYRRLSPYLTEIDRGRHDVLLPEPLLCWVMTRGSTGPAKVLPVTSKHVEQIVTCGSRALINHVLRKKDFELMAGKILNLNFPSNVHTATVNGQKTTYGYSSGTYARLNPALERVSLVPRQEEIDALGSGLARRDWERRFELAYERALGENLTAVMGVTPVILAFARYVERKHGKKPGDLWKFRALFCTSVRKIHFRYAPLLRGYFGAAPVVEIYSATEGVFAQQIDDLPYVTPNYDTYFFEVEMPDHSLKMLHELKRGEWGKLIISSSLLPRYDIGDIIEAAGKNYFRVVGRNRIRVLLEHRLYRLIFRWAL